MALRYIYSGAAGAGTGADWTNAYTTLTLAFAADTAGDTLYVAHDHSESSAANLTFASSGIVSNPVKVVCVNRAGSVPPVSADRRTTAQVATTGNATISYTGFTHYDGIIFVAGNSTGAAHILPVTTNSGWTRFDNCSLRMGSTGAGQIQVGAAAAVHAAYAEFNNTTASFSAVTQGFLTTGTLIWRNTASALIGAQVPTNLFLSQIGRTAVVDCMGVDLSAAGAGKNIVGATNNAVAQRYRFLDCKLNASVTKSVVPDASGNAEIDFVRSGATGLNYTVFRHRISGTLDHETTIVRTGGGGASDGTTTISWKVVTTANCNYSMPFECPPIAIWNDTTGSPITATVECIGAAVGTDKEVWLECQYLGDGSSPQGSFATDAADILATAANQTSSSETWGGSTAAFKLAVTFTAAQKGWIYARVKIAKASSTFYVDPLVTLT